MHFKCMPTCQKKYNLPTYNYKIFHMSTGIFLSYNGLGANILHLSYCHEIAKVFGPVNIITLSKNFKHIVEDDPLVKNVIFLDIIPA